MKNYFVAKLKLPILVVIVLFTSSLISAQRVEITPYYGYMFAGKITAYQGDFNIRNDANYGIMLDFEVDRKNGISVELLYDRMDTKADFITYPTNITTELFNMSEEYFQVGGHYNKPIDKKLSTFFGFSLGATRFHPKDEQFGDDWRFSMTLGGGMKYFFSKTIGVRLQARLKMPFYFGGSGFYYNGIAYSSGSALLQGDLTAGLIFQIGK